MRPGHRRIFSIKIQKAREKQKREEEDQEEIRKKKKAKQKREELAAEKREKQIRKREEMQQKSKQEMEDELAKIEMSKKLERARQKRGKMNTSIAAGEVENKEGGMTHATASTDLHHAFISHKKKHTKFGDHYEMLSIRLKVKLFLLFVLPLPHLTTCCMKERLKWRGFNAFMDCDDLQVWM
jgi:hypothetical protein